MLAVSGGVDSMVMARLMHQWADTQAIDLCAVVVDHRLRPDSAAEAQWTKNQLAHMGMPAVVVVNRLPKVVTGIQAYARQVRYTLLHKACRQMGADAVCVAHHYNDCLETVAMRLQRGSTPYGLSAMNMVFVSPEGRVIRPLLNIHKTAIEQYAHRHNIAHVDDPSNENTDFTRVRVRKRLATDADFYRHVQTVYTESLAFRRHMDRVVSDFITSCVTPMYGVVRIDIQALHRQNHTHTVYILRHLLMWVSGNYTPPRSRKLHTLITLIQRAKPATLHGCYIRALQKSLWIWRQSYDITQCHRFVCERGNVRLYGTVVRTGATDATHTAFARIPKLVRQNMPVCVYQENILPLNGEKIQKYDKHAILFVPPPFIL